MSGQDFVVSVTMQSSILVVFALISSSRGKLITSSPSEYLSNYFDQLRLLVAEMLYIAQVNRCYAIITDDTHYVVFEKSVFEKPRQLHVNFFLRIPDSEDLLVPNYQTVRVLKEIQAQNCDLHLILLSNGHQASRLMIFLDDYRLLNSRAKFVFLHDHRVLAKDMIYIWRNFVQSIFLRWRLTDKGNSKGQFSILTVPYPNILKGVVLTKELSTWKDGKFRNKVSIFQDKTKDFMGVVLKTVVFEHTPMVMKTKDGGYRGLEVEIIRSLEKVLNFKAFFYETKDAETERWGRILPNRSFTGLIGEMVNRKAKLAIGDLHLNGFYSNVMDLSAPHTHECLTFLTPESSRDNSWKTLVLPFSANTWACVLSAELIVGTVFYIVSFSHSVSIVGQASRKQDFFSFFKKRKSLVDPKMFRDVKFRSSLNRRTARRGTVDLFDDFSNCILLTFSMSLYVALPRMPKNWPLRILTGWYWMYCITLVVFYRASFTAILANPAPRITIDTLEDLARSTITASVWGAENQKFFNEAFDEVAQDIGEQLELVDDIYGVTDRIAKGYFAYYDNVFFLRYLRHLGSQRREDAEILHIMNECVVNMPISIGMEKNSLLKPIVDKYLAWMKESGLMAKWLKDATEDLPSEEMAPQEALMNLKKFWSSFVALGLGYLLSVLTIITETIYFKYIVAKHPLYDKYNPRIYYNFQRRFNQ